MKGLRPLYLSHLTFTLSEVHLSQRPLDGGQRKFTVRRPWSVTAAKQPSAQHFDNFPHCLPAFIERSTHDNALVIVS